MAPAKKTVKIERTGGESGHTKAQLGSLKGLGLSKRHQVRELEDTPAVRGMIARVAHLVRVIDDAR